MTLSVNRLAKSLVAGELNESEKIKYYLAAIYLQLINAGIPAYFWGSKLDNVGAVSFGLGAIVATLCIVTIKNVNDKIDGRNVIERLSILSFPAFLQSIALYLVVYLGITALYVVTGVQSIYFIFSLLGLSFYYWVGFELIRKALMKNIV